VDQLLHPGRFGDVVLVPGRDVPDPADRLVRDLQGGEDVVEEAVLAEAGLLIPDENDDEPSTAVREDEVEKFKEFLDSVSPDDFKAT